MCGVVILALQIYKAKRTSRKYALTRIPRLWFLRYNQNTSLKEGGGRRKEERRMGRQTARSAQRVSATSVSFHFTCWRKISKETKPGGIRGPKDWQLAALGLLLRHRLLDSVGWLGLEMVAERRKASSSSSDLGGMSSAGSQTGLLPPWQSRRARLVLEDGSEFVGWSFGAESAAVAGEVGEKRKSCTVMYSTHCLILLQK